MDFESLKSQVSNLTLYDLKAGVRKVQNAVMNLTEMESKVREATNADPWGAPSSLMMEIASGTHNYQQLNEIMPMIYKRFTEKAAEEWRQIYKALQLLEFLVKNGSERVVDDARSHLSLLRMLKQFHFIDQNGKDQGINVRNRSVELAKLLSDVEQIRAERKKARTNRNKYGGVEGGASIGGGFSSGSRFGGFGNESSSGYGGYSGEVYGDGGGFGGRETDFSGTQRRGDQFEEYDEDEEGTGPVRTTRTTAPATASAATRKEPPKPKEPEQDLFDFGDEPVTSPVAKAPAGGFGMIPNNTVAAADDDDDFDDFQSATTPAATTHSSANPLAALSPPPSMSTTTSSTQFAAPRPVAAAQASNLKDLFATTSPPPQSAVSPAAATMPAFSPAPMQAAMSRPTGPNYYTSVRADINTTSSGAPAALSARPAITSNQPSYGSSTTAASLGKPVAKTVGGAGGDAFSSLWSTASTKAGVQGKTQATKGPDLASMAKAKSEAGIWGPSSAAGTPKPATPVSYQQKPATPLGNGLDDLLG